MAMLMSGLASTASPCAKILRQRIEQRIHAETVLRRNRKNLVAQLVKLRGEVRLLRRIHFVHGDHRRLARAPQQLRQLRIERHGPCAAVHHLHHARRVFNRHARLPQNFAGNSGFVLRHDSARIHHFERAPFPVRRRRRCGRA